MPPVPVRIDDPITPTKPEFTQPQTAQQPDSQIPTPAATTTTSNGSSAYTPARPGAAAMPAPTPYVPPPQPAATRTQAPIAAQDFPPPPQPGAVPVPLNQQVPLNTTATLPPPPKAGESLNQRQVSMPTQMQVPPPQQNSAHLRSTSGYLPPTQQPTTLSLGPVNQAPAASHPPGYHQNTSAQEMSSAQRSSLDQDERSGTIMGGLGGDSAGESAANMWNTVKSWANTAGEKLVETEESVWKRINGR